MVDWHEEYNILLNRVARLVSIAESGMENSVPLEDLKAILDD